MIPDVLHINISDAGGGVGKAAYRLHKSLNAVGCDSWMLVDTKLTEDPKVLSSCNAIHRLYSKIRSRADKFPCALCNTGHWEYASFNYLPNPFVKQAWKRIRPRLLHLHWLGDGYMPIHYFPQFASVPTVATLHGRWLFNGAQHLHSDQSKRFREGFCKDNRDNMDGGLDLDRWVWNRKMRYFKNNPFEVLVLSNWMKRDAQNSVLLGKRPIHLIPNGLDLSVYYPYDTVEARNHFNLPQGKPLVLFGANFATQDRNKGFHDFVEAMKILELEQDPSFEVVVFGSDRPSGALPYRTHTHFLGYLRNEGDLVKAYSACNCFVLPSHQDNLPNTVMEAMACGTPCIAYDVGGVSDMVENRRNGFLVTPRDVKQLAFRISQMVSFNKSTHFLFSTQALEKIQKDFSEKLQIQRMIELYEGVIERHSRS